MPDESVPAVRGQFLPLGVRFPTDMDFNEWVRAGETIAYFNRSIQFLVGDWVNFGDAMFGEKYAQALDSTKYSYQTLRNAVYVCNRIPLEFRRDTLTFEHHRLVAPLTEADREILLDRCEEEGLTTKELRAIIAEMKGKEDKKKPSCYADWLEQYCQETDSKPTMAEITFGEVVWDARK